MSSNVIEITPPADELKQTALTLPQQAKAIIITDQATYEVAAEKLLGVAALRRQIVDYHKPLKQKAHEAHAAICAAEAGMLAPVAEAEMILKRGIGAYQAEQARIQEQREREAREKAEREAAELLEQQLEAAEAEGATPEEVQAIIEQPAPAPVIRVEPTIQRAAGISTAKIYRAEVFDIKKLARAVADGCVAATLIEGNTVALNQLARATKGSVAIPGVRVIEEQAVRVARR